VAIGDTIVDNQEKDNGGEDYSENGKITGYGISFRGGWR
jgi:hypothetical protein